MAHSLLAGHAPYLQIWDRKPVGVFIVFAAIQAVAGDSVIALRIATSLAIGLGAFFLAQIGRVLFPAAPRIGSVAGALFLIYSMRNGGQGANAEHFFVPLDLAAGWLVLRRPGFLPGLAAGLLFGVALQVKYSAVFDILAFALIFLARAIQQRIGLRAVLLTGFGALAGILLPTEAVFVWYVRIDRFDALYSSNFSANAALIGETAPPFSLSGLFDRLRENDVLTLGAIAAFLAAPVLRLSREARLGLLALALWLAAMVVGQVFLRRFADHFFIEVLPPLALAAALFLVSALARLPAGRAATLALGAVVLLIAAWVARVPVSAAVETVQRRESVPHWGDRTATVAAALRPRLGPADTIYVAGNAGIGGEPSANGDHIYATTFTLTTASSPTQTATAGATVTYMLALGPTDGLTFPVPAIMSVTGLPPGATATLTPPVAPAGFPLTSVSLKVQLATSSASLDRKQLPNRRVPPVVWSILFVPFLGTLRRRNKSLRWTFCRLLLVGATLAAITGLNGCGSNSNGFFNQSPQTIYPLTVTATAGAVSHSVTVTLIVN